MSYDKLYKDVTIGERILINDGNINNEGKVLKSSSGWNISSGNGTDFYGFNALPNGYVDSGSQPKVDGVICVLTAIENDLILNIEILENTIFIEDTPGTSFRASPKLKVLYL